MDCRRFQSTIRLISGILLVIGNVSSYYNKSYDGYAFILPGAAIERSESRSLKSFSAAQQWCKRNVAGSTLTTIRNKDVQQNIAQFIENSFPNIRPLTRSGYENIRLNGEYHITDEWRWVNGQPIADITVHERNENSMSSFYARLDTKNFNIYSANPTIIGYFICEYPGKSQRCDLFLNGRCYQKKHYSFNWYNARNKCLDGGGDLASFETLNHTSINVSLKNLSLNTNADYWIGLKKNEWRWENTGSSIMFTNWEDYHPSNHSARCLCLTSFQWKWKECECSEEYPFICIINDAGTTLRTGSSVTSIKTKTVSHITSSIDLPSTTSAIVSTSVIPLSCATSTLFSSNGHSPPNNTSAVIGAVVSRVILVVIIIIVAFCIMIIVIVVVAVVIIIRKPRNRAVSSSRDETFEAPTVTTTNEMDLPPMA